MSHIPVSVVVTASGSADDLHACLETLRDSVGVRDEVVCVLPPDRQDLRAELAGRTWLTVLQDDSGDQAHRWATGIAATRHPVLVLLDGDVVLSARWLDPVLEPFQDGTVVATGPRCHHSYGPQQASLPDTALASVAAFRSFAREWRQRHRGRFTDVDELGPVCMAVRRDALSLAGGPTFTLPFEHLRAQGRIVVSHAALVAHTASPKCALRTRDDRPAPLLSANLMVKDEEAVLGACLASLRPLVDEIIVYDTGSTDRTKEIAVEHGATLIEGYWNDSFGEGRSRALSHCHGQWILSVDADEVVLGDPEAIRALLTGAAPDVTGFMVRVDNEVGHAGSSNTSSLLSPRLFRREHARFSGRLHEQLVDDVHGRLIAGVVVDEMTVNHSGYTLLRGVMKEKGDRNLRLAELAATDQQDPGALGNLARSQMSMNRFADAVETCRKGLSLSEEHYYRVTFLKLLADAYVNLNRLDEATAVIEELRGIVRFAVSVDEHEAKLRFAENDYERTLAVIERIPEHADNDLLFGVDRDAFSGMEVLSLSALGRHDDAARRLRERLRAGVLPISLIRAGEVFEAVGSTLAEVAELLPFQNLRGVLFTAGEAPAPVADDLLETLWQRYPGNPSVLALAARVGRQVSIVRAMEWSARLRKHGFAAECTLVALAADEGRTARERSLAAAIALELFGDDAALPLLAGALELVDDADSDAVLAEMRVLAPGVASSIELVDA